MTDHQQVIKAKFDYTPHPDHSQELPFAKGDFFHVISREEDPNWYEACNPLIPTARGLVPVPYFEVVGKQDRQSAGSTQSSNTLVTSPQPDATYPEMTNGNHQLDGGSTGRKSGHLRMSSLGKGSGAMVYGVVIYDFKAERPDELEAEAGESIIIIAQSNPEWFVAKPIKRLGGPGLIPVTFIEIRDMNTGQPVADPNEAVQRAGVPKVEEWKRLAANYKNSSIPLGKFSDGGMVSTQKDMERMSLNTQQSGNSQSHHQRQSSRGAQNNHDRHSQKSDLFPISASIPRYIFENDKYWYIIECQLEDSRWWELSRTYQKFYDFQIALLQRFPREAQTPPGGKRVLPFMPGPVTYVTDAISNGRRESLNTYVKELLALPPYISRCDLVRELFAPTVGDYELDPEKVTESYRHSSGSQSSIPGEGSRTVSRQSSHEQMDGNGPVNGYGNMDPPPPKTAQLNGGQHHQHYRNQSDLNYHQQGIKPQPSTLTQASSTHSSGPNASSTSVNKIPPSNHAPGNTQASAGGAMKIKVNFQDETIVIRVPSDIAFSTLREKCRDRLRIPDRDEIMVSYRDDQTGGNYEMLSDRDLDMALSRCQRLVLTVGFV